MEHLFEYDELDKLKQDLEELGFNSDGIRVDVSADHQSGSNGTISFGIISDDRETAIVKLIEKIGKTFWGDYENWLTYSYANPKLTKDSASKVAAGSEEEIAEYIELLIDSAGSFSSVSVDVTIYKGPNDKHFSDLVPTVSLRNLDIIGIDDSQYFDE